MASTHVAANTAGGTYVEFGADGGVGQSLFIKQDDFAARRQRLSSTGMLRQAKEFIAFKRWLTRHPQYHLHFTPTSASWLNQVERVFGDLTEKQLRRGVFKSVASLEKSALDYLDNRNDDAKPFIWTADADTILGRVAKHHATFSKSGH